MSRKIVILILATASLYSCISTQELESFVYMKYAQQSQTMRNNDYMEYDNIKLNEMDSSVKTKKLKARFIPAIIVYEWNTTIKCDLSKKQSFLTFNNYFQYYADSLNIKEKLNGQKLIISIDSIPDTFVYINEGYIENIFSAYVDASEGIYPENEKLIFSYRVVQGSNTTKSGRIEMRNVDAPLLNAWKSTKKLTWLYLDRYENNLRYNSRLAIEQLNSEL
jgi:hypothetical protein